MTELILSLGIAKSITADIFYREPSKEELADAWAKTVRLESDTNDTYNPRLTMAKNDLGQILTSRIEINGEEVEKEDVPLLLIALGQYILNNLEEKEGRA